MVPRVAYFGNSQSAFSNRHFLALVDIPCELVAVVDVPPSGRASTNPDEGDLSTFVEIARRRGIEVLQPASPNLPEFVADMRGLVPDLLLAAGYSKVLGEQIRSVPRLPPVNLHASLLPAYRGKHPVFWALRHGERWAGLTAHIMEAGLDTGDILYQVRVRVGEQDTVASLYDRIMDESVDLVGLLVKDAEDGRFRPMPQLQEGASYHGAVAEDDFFLDWTREAEVLRHWIHITPGKCFCEVRGSRVFFVDAQVAGRAGGEVPGTLIRLDESCGDIATGMDALRVCSVRLGERDLSLRQACEELGLRAGDRLD